MGARTKSQKQDKTVILQDSFKSYNHNKITITNKTKGEYRATRLNWTDTVKFSTNWPVGKQGEPIGH